MLNVNDVNKFFVRIKEYAPFPNIDGQIIYIREVSSEAVELSFTDDCKPVNKVIKLPANVNDNGWYDVTSLIMKANMSILPKYSKCQFLSDVAASYRNHIDGSLVKLSEEQAKGKICFIGTNNGRGVSLGKQGYFIIDTDSNGYMLAYSGFCGYLEFWEKPTIQQRVLRLTGSNRSLYSAKEIVDTCNQLYEEDLNKSDNYIGEFNNMSSASGSDSSAAREVFDTELYKLRLS